MLQNGGRPALAIANYDFRASGTVGKSIQIASASAEAGIPTQLWAVRTDGPLLAQVPREVEVIGIGERVRRPSRETDLAFAIPAFAREIRRRSPAILLSGGIHLHIPAALALRLSGERKRVRLGLRASNSSQRPGKNPRRLRERLKYRDGDFVVAVSEELAEEISALGIKGELRCIPNGVDLEKVERLAQEPFSHPFLDLRAIDGQPVLIGVGRLARQKGFDLLLQALARIPPPLCPRLMLIGDGDELGSLMQDARRLGVAERVAFLGYQANPFAILAKADLFVSASRWEGSSNALLEALAVGLPLVATDCPTGNREVIEGGRCGTLARMEDPEALCAAIVRELGAQRSGDLQREAARHWDVARCLADWVKLLANQYETALNERLPS